MADMFGNDDQSGRQDNEDGVRIEYRGIEGWQSKPGGLFDQVFVYDAAAGCEDVSADNAEKNRDDRKKTAKGDRGEHSDSQCSEGDENGCTVSGVLSSQPGHTSCRRHEFQPDNGYDCAHRCRRENDIDPTGSYGSDQ